MSHQAQRRVGAVIASKWRVDALLGSGSMAAVYAATHRNGARAALKILHPTLCADRAVCERFLGEGYLTNAVKHPGIVRVLDDGVTEDGCVFLVMDLLEGMTLEALRQERGGRIGLLEVLDIADKLMDVLRAVHEANIIHRDLKPQNVFVCDDGSVKLLDFGVARGWSRAEQNKLSMFGLVLGTPSFMSPEQALGAREQVDHRSDIWSLGATLFTSLTGQTVHLGPNVQARLLAAATAKARSIAIVMPELPAPLAAAIDMALRFDRGERWQSVEAFQRTLREVRSQLGHEPTPSGAPARGGNGNGTKRARGPSGTIVGLASLDAPPALEPERKSSSDDVAGNARPAPAVLAEDLRDAVREDEPVSDLDRPSHEALLETAIDLAGLRAPRPRPRIGVWLGAAFLVVVAASGVAFFAIDRGDPRAPAASGASGVELARAEPPPQALASPAAVPKSGAGQVRGEPADRGAPASAVARPDAGNLGKAKSAPSRQPRGATRDAARSEPRPARAPAATAVPAPRAAPNRPSDGSPGEPTPEPASSGDPFSTPD